ncbi:MAG: hypothetical protein A2Y17_04410 [Clostridiales bacterium GWF2_38_85]|nr:MAG: hypothetical protein A2Y17_04410 [Clostridiales bacterium GWF2_38_85]HBL83405.1 hypothetical protein [Clostridiales bacterium]
MSISGTTLRLSGMVSGLDTDSIVENLMEASKLKIQAVEQQKITLEWKQEYYKEITNKLYDFQKKYYGSTSSSSLTSSKLNSLTPSYNSSYISVTASSSSSADNIYIDDIVSLASSTKLVSSVPISSNPTIQINTDALSELAGKNIVVNLNGVEKLLTFTDHLYASSSDVQTELQSLIDNAFGSEKVNVDLDSNKLTLSSDNNTLILKTPTDGSDPSSILTFDSYSSNRIDFNVSLDSVSLASSPVAGTDIGFTVNGKSFSFTSSNTLSQIMADVNSSDAGVKMSYSSLTDTFSMISNETGVTSDVVVSDTTGTLMNSLFGTGIKTSGTDAVVKLSPTGSTYPADIITVTRSSNTLSVDGTTISLLGKAEGTSIEAINISLKRDNDAIYDTIKSFVDDYNSMLSSITSKLAEERDTDYTPLTAAQKEDMSESEITLWTNKAKAGLLRGDIYLKTIESELRSIFYSPVMKLGDNTSSLGVASDIGISTTNYSDKGKLTIGETKLRNAINSDPDKVLGILTQKSSVSYSLYSTQEIQQQNFNESGIIERLGNILIKNLNNIGVKGALINLVGSPTDTYTKESDYSKRIQTLDDKIENMNEKLADEEDRYWKQFTAMETALSKLNQQSSWISNMLGTNQNQ